MTNYEEQLAIDFATLSNSEIFDKYWCKIQAGTTIYGIVQALRTKELLSAMIRTDWRNDGKDPDGLYLIKDNHRYQVFMGERGIKLQLEEFPDLLTASLIYVDWALCQLSYVAPDSKIG